VAVRVELAREIWERAISRQPAPSPDEVAVIGVVALALVLAPATWPRVRLGVTIVHEAGHAMAAVLTGRRLQGIRIHSDTSGLTVTRGRPRGPGMILVLAGGYLAPALLGVGAALLLVSGHSLGLLWLLVLLLALMLVHVRNLYGFGALLVAGVAMAAVSWYAAPVLQSLLAYLLTWVLLLAAPRPVVELLSRGRAGRRSSDPAQLASLTRVPAVLWTLLFLVLNVAGLAVGLTTLVPGWR